MHFVVVFVGTLDKNWAMALCCYSQMFWSWTACTLCMRIDFSLLAGGQTVSCNVQHIRR